MVRDPFPRHEHSYNLTSGAAPMNIEKMADEIIEMRKRHEHDAIEARLAADKADPSRRPMHGTLVAPATCHHEFFLDGLGQCSNCGTYVGLPR